MESYVSATYLIDIQSLYNMDSISDKTEAYRSLKCVRHSCLMLTNYCVCGLLMYMVFGMILSFNFREAQFSSGSKHLSYLYS